MQHAMRFSLRWLFLLIAFSAISFWIYRSAYPLGGTLIWILFWATVCSFALRWERRWAATGAGMLVLLGLLSLPVIAMTGHSVPVQDLERIKTGDTAQQVSDLLGSPTRVLSQAEGESWQYVGPSMVSR